MKSKRIVSISELENLLPSIAGERATIIFERFKFDYGYYRDGITKSRTKGTLFHVNKIGNFDTYKGKGMNLTTEEINKTIATLFP